MIILDAHCDTLTKIMETNSNLFNNTSHVDLKRLKNLGKYVQFFAAFIDPIYCQAYALKRALQIIDVFYKQLEIYKDDMMLCCNYNDVSSALSEDKIAAVLSIEGGEALQGDIGVLRMLYKLGVRSICLTWNYRNEIADGVLDGQSKGGLTAFGKDVIKEMNGLGMLVDVSHISERGFFDVLETSSKPIIASHSNSKKICNHVRNLTDSQILALKENGGVTGINLCPEFLCEGGNAGIKDIMNHIEYIVSLVGEDHLGLGADFDGIDKLPNDINGVEHIDKIIDGLFMLNYSKDTIEKIMGGNFLRLIKSCML